MIHHAHISYEPILDVLLSNPKCDCFTRFPCQSGLVAPISKLWITVSPISVFGIFHLKAMDEEQMNKDLYVGREFLS